MAAPQRKMVSTYVREHDYSTDTQQQPVKQPSRKIFSVGEKFLFILFSTILVLFSTMILHTQAELNDHNREVQRISNQIEETKKQNNELAIQKDERSTHEVLWQKAKELGLNLNDANVKVVPGK